MITTISRSALAEQELTSNSPPLGRVLVRLGAIDEDELTATLAEQFGMRVVDLSHEAKPDPATLARFPREAAYRLQALPLRYEDGRLIVVVTEPPTRETQREVLRLSGRQAAFVLASTKTVLEALEEWFPHPSTVVGDLCEGTDTTIDVGPLSDEVHAHRSPAQPQRSEWTLAETSVHLPTAGRVNINEPRGRPKSGEDADRPASTGVRVDDPIVAWLLTHAGDLGAASVHLVDESSRLRVRVRVNRKMQETTMLPGSAGTILVRRILHASGLDVESRETQRGWLPAVPGVREQWHVRSTLMPSGRVLILRPTKPAPPNG